VEGIGDDLQNTSKLVRLTTSTKTSTYVDYQLNLLDTTTNWA
jgi:hypothetical protein